MEDVGTRRRIFLSLSELRCGPQKFNPWEIHLRWPFSELWNKRSRRRSRFKSSQFTERVVSYLFILLIHSFYFEGIRLIILT